MYIPFSDRVAISSVLGLLAGYVDVICLVRYGAFAVTQTGNIIFWLTIMLGQPMIVLLYARDYQQVCLRACVRVRLSSKGSPGPEV